MLVDLLSIFVMVLLAIWAAQPAGQALLLGRAVRDDFGYVVPHVQRQFRQQIASLLLRLLLALIVMSFLAYASGASV